MNEKRKAVVTQNMEGKMKPGAIVVQSGKLWSLIHDKIGDEWAGTLGDSVLWIDELVGTEWRRTALCEDCHKKGTIGERYIVKSIRDDTIYFGDYKSSNFKHFFTHFEPVDKSVFSNESGSKKTTKQINKKGKTKMNTANVLEEICDGLITDEERAHKYCVKVFNNDGEAISEEYFRNKKDMRNELVEWFNKPEGIGSVAKVYKLYETLTTEVPIVGVKEK